jgi:hypothetical protein
MKKTYNEILEILKENIDSVHQFAYEDYDETSLNLGNIKEVYHEGGEDQGSHWESVKYFEDHDVYISVVGYYTSYDGTDFYNGWDGCCSEVRPIEKIVTFYESIK